MANKTWVGTDTGNEGDWGTAANWSPSGVPTTGDDVRIPAGSYAISGTLNQSAVPLGDVIVEAGYTEAIGTSAANLQIDPNRFEFAGTGTSYIDLGSAAIDVIVSKTGSASTGLRALYLIGSAIATMSVYDGKVGLASRHGTTATATTVRVLGGSLWIGEGTTLTTLECNGGETVLRAGATTVKLFAGTLATEEQGAITTLTCAGGTADLSSSGTITTLNLDGGAVSFLNSGIARTVSTLKINGGQVRYDPNVMTITAFAEADNPIIITSSAV